MKIAQVPQLSLEWWKLKVGKISGTRFSKIISGKKNRIIYEIMDEILSNEGKKGDFVTDDMQYGIDNEDVAIEEYTRQTGTEVYKTGAIISELNDIHMASPDALSIDNKRVIEVKCTMNGYIHLQRIFEGVELTYMPQIKNYFTVDDGIKYVDFVSYCGFRPERPLYIKTFTREEFEKDIPKYRALLSDFKEKLSEMIKEYSF